MRVVQIVFSPTGGTQRTADAVTEVFGVPASRIDLTQHEGTNEPIKLTEEDLAIIAFPSYGGRVPPPAAQRFSHLEGRHAACILICVYGNRAYEDTLAEMGDLARHAGFRIVAAISAVAEHSIAHQYAAGRPDHQDIETLQGYARQIIEKLNSTDGRFISPTLPRNHPYKKTVIPKLVPKATHSCTLCGSCARKCPAQAISHSNPMETDKRKCISCMRCITQCPMSARKLNSALILSASVFLKSACSIRKEAELFL